MKDLQITKSYFGEGFKIILRGAADEIQFLYQKLWNYGYINSKLSWITNEAGSFYMTRQGYKKSKIDAETSSQNTPSKFAPDIYNVNTKQDLSREPNSYRRLPLDTIVRKLTRN